MDSILKCIDDVDDNVLVLEQIWYETYWTRFTQFLGYCVEKVVGKGNPLSELYRLTTKLKGEIPITIHYDECSICLELIVEVSNEPGTVCITKCNHIFHHACLARWFKILKECPNCQANLQSIPERMLARGIELQQIADPLKPAQSSVERIQKILKRSLQLDTAIHELPTDASLVAEHKTDESPRIEHKTDESSRGEHPTDECATGEPPKDAPAGGGTY
ncbi:unnamed protein product [Rotaria socialis]|uniref:RING-type domain-containing protein n=1 Tax=Rotaria socialis TaxID=392032 RepID=A0A818JED8_9BILA|nr:unnamed protein product [Rotaria socialis]